MGTEINDSGGSGTQIQPGASGTVFTEINLLATVVADASVTPADSPALDTMRLMADATPRIFLWWYRNSLDDWYGVELTP